MTICISYEWLNRLYDFELNIEENQVNDIQIPLNISYEWVDG